MPDLQILRPVWRGDMRVLRWARQRWPADTDRLKERALCIAAARGLTNVIDLARAWGALDVYTAFVWAAGAGHVRAMMHLHGCMTQPGLRARAVDRGLAWAQQGQQLRAKSLALALG